MNTSAQSSDASILGNRRGKRFSRDYYAQFFGVRRGNATVVDVACLQSPQRACFVVQCVCGYKWRTVIRTFFRNKYSYRCGHGDCTAPRVSGGEQ